MQEAKTEKLGSDEINILAEVVHNMQVGLHLYHLEDLDDDRTLRMVATNPAATQFTGVPMQDVLGNTLDENFPGLREKGIPRLYAEVVRSGEAKELEDVYYGDERVIYGAFAVKAFPLPGNHVGVVFENITERKKTEQELDKARAELENRVEERTRQLKEANLELMVSEEKYRNLYETMEQGVVYQAADGKIISANPASERILGLTLDQMTGRTSFDPGWKAIKEDGSDFPGDEHPSMVSLRTGRPFRDVVMGMFHPGLEDHRWIVINAVPQFREGEDRAFQVFTTFADITEHKRAEKARLELEGKVLQAQKLESLGVLAGGIAHDFNNLLMGVLGNADVALEELAPESNVQPYLQDIKTAAMRLAELTKQMLAYSGRGKFLVVDLNLSRLVEEMVHLLEVSISKKVVIKYDLASDLATVKADASQIRQVVMNLITNAAEACQDKSGVVSIRTGTVEADRDYISKNYLNEDLPEGLYAFLDVSDTGAGMDEDTLSRVFDPFFSTKFTGRGLGLAAVLGIVRGHKGTIKVYSEPGRGSTFKVLLPASERAAAEEAKPRPAEGWIGSGTVLLVDDEDSVRNIGRRMLEKLGFKVMTASDGREAVEVIRERIQHIDLVLLDLAMPHKDGIEVFREIRGIKADLPVILSSGYNEQEATSHFAGKGLAGFIQKPYQLAALKDKLMTVIGEVEE